MTGEQIVLAGGLWLDPAVWSGVVAELGERGRRAVPVTLPGQGDGNMAATLADQVSAVLDAVDAGPGRSVVVGHSAACTLAWLAADARPERLARVVLIGGFPSGDGEKYADFFPIAGGVMPFPGWAPFEGADAADLDEPARQSFAAAAIGVPEAVARGVVRLTDDRRFDVPVSVVCPEFTPDQARAAIAGGDAPELARAKHVEFADIDSGHWPMLTRPAELATILAAL
jgi:pimeloyl-ACP methyl ester carboxylesterase